MALGARKLDDDAVLLAMARQVLGGPREEGRCSYQVSLTVCKDCGRGAQLACGDLVPVDVAVVAMAQCDAQHLGELLPRAANENASFEAGAVATEREWRGGPAETDADASAGPSGDPDDAHVGASGRPPAEPATAVTDTNPVPRAKQSVSPALRRAVLTRDQHCCSVPGCTHATFVDVHHVLPRSERGRNEAS